MGSDSSPQVLFDAVIQAAKQVDPTDTFFVFSTEEAYQSLKDLHEKMGRLTPLAKIEFVFSSEEITMRDDPLVAIRSKKNSSLIQGIKALKRKSIEAFVTAGNTGALIASSALSLPLLPNIRRPGLLAQLPTEKKEVAILDVGGNVQCKAQDLVRFAELGVCFTKIHHRNERVKVGLLNVGVESKKGTVEHRHAYELLQKISFNSPDLQFVGNVEGREIFQGKVDVVVTDGFTGNVLLKTTEGFALFILDYLNKMMSLSSPSQAHFVQELQLKFSYNEYPGAILMGIDGILVKCHGDATTKTMYNGIQSAISYVKQNLIEKIKIMLISQSGE